jgi:glutaredoxin 3
MGVLVYSKANCPACTKVKKQLTAKGIDFTEVRVDQNPPDRQFLLDQGHKSVPQVYVFDKHVDPDILNNEILAQWDAEWEANNS